MFSAWILLALAISLVSNVLVAARKWHLILHALGHRIDYRFVLYVKLATDAVIAVVPLRGGEILRAWYLSKRHGVPLTDGVGSIVVELGFNFAALVGLAGAGWVALTSGSIALGCGVLLALTVAAVLAALPIGRQFLRLLPERPPDDRSFLGSLYSFFRSLASMGPGTLCAVTGYSLFVAFLEVISVALIFRAFVIEVHYAELFAYLPIIALVGRMPFSVSGLGVRESTLVLAFHHLCPAGSGALLGAGLMYSFVEFLFPTLVGLPVTAHFLSTFPIGGKQNWKAINENDDAY